jgi:hypothetical protein
VACVSFHCFGTANTPNSDIDFAQGSTSAGGAGPTKKSISFHIEEAFSSKNSKASSTLCFVRSFDQRSHRSDPLRKNPPESLRHHKDFDSILRQQTIHLLVVESEIESSLEMAKQLRCVGPL